MKNMRRRKIVSSVALNVVIAVLAMLWLSSHHCHPVQ